MNLNVNAAWTRSNPLESGVIKCLDREKQLGYGKKNPPAECQRDRSAQVPGAIFFGYQIF